MKIQRGIADRLHFIDFYDQFVGRVRRAVLFDRNVKTRSICFFVRSERELQKLRLAVKHKELIIVIRIRRLHKLVGNKTSFDVV